MKLHSFEFLKILEGERPQIVQEGKEKKRGRTHSVRWGGGSADFFTFLVGAWGFVEGAAFTHLTFLDRILRDD